MLKISVSTADGTEIVEMALDFNPEDLAALIDKPEHLNRILEPTWAHIKDAIQGS